MTDGAFALHGTPLHGPPELSPEERRVLAHTTGWDTIQPLYRNHYCAGPDHAAWSTLQLLCERGLMSKRTPWASSGGDTIFTATEAGIQALERDRDGGRK